MSAKSTQNAASRAGSAKHFAKMKLHAAQLQKQGPMTGGLATSPGAPVVHNPVVKTKSLGKVQ